MASRYEIMQIDPNTATPVSYTLILSPNSRWVLYKKTTKWRSGARSATTAGTSAPPEVRGTSGATDHDVQSWFACNGFSVCGERSIRLLLRAFSGYGTPTSKLSTPTRCVNTHDPQSLASPSTKGFTKNSEPVTSLPALVWCEFSLGVNRGRRGGTQREGYARRVDCHSLPTEAWLQ